MSTEPPRTVRVRVRPGVRRDPGVVEGDDGVLIVAVRERAVEGAANSAVERALAEHFGLPRSRVEIVRGHTARIKTVRVG
ncbi:MAG: DUF167 domain-containing protein [Actinomycetales bacterium]|nr:DUF167 domain-containing protein [Actinomycetales bacterium]